MSASEIYVPESKELAKSKTFNLLNQ